jgi:hypothetical protein
MSDIIKSEVVNGYTVNVKYDDFPDNPRNWDNLGTMYFQKMSGWDFKDVTIPEYWEDEEGESWDISDQDSFEAWRGSEGDKLAIVLPIYIYEHSGIVLRTRQTTPAGVISGYITVTEEKLLAEYGKIDDETIKTATEVLSSEVDTYSQYVNGEVYYSEVLDGEEFIDGCGGYYDIDEAFGVGRDTAERLGTAESYTSYVLGKTQVGLLVGLLEQTIQEIPSWDTFTDEEKSNNNHLLFQYKDIVSRLTR